MDLAQDVAGGYVKPAMTARRAWIAVSILLLAAAGALFAVRELFLRDPNPQIHVRWDEGLDTAARSALEREFGLVVLQDAGTDTWRYELTDPSRQNIERIVRHDTVADTHYIDREAFEVGDDAPRAAPRPGRFTGMPPWLAYAFARVVPVVLVGLGVVAVMFAARPRWAEAAWFGFSHSLTRGIPEVTPSTLAVFRVVLGLALAAFVFLNPHDTDPLPRAEHRTNAPLVDMEIVHWLGEHSSVVRAGQWVAIGSLALFAAGVVPRATYAVGAIAIVQWLFTRALRNGSHPFGVLIFPLLFLIAAPWHVREGPPSKRLGYAPWFLGLALGVAWAGAVYAKIGGGLDWVLDGAVRYHFVTDIEYARVPWGLQIAANPGLSVLLSGLSVVVESLPLVAVFSRSPWLRLVAAIAGMGLLANFYMFMGLFWPAWWILHLGLLPWEWLNRAARAVPTPAAPALLKLTRPQLACVLLLFAQQIAVSAVFTEFEPVSSRYDMYSKSYSSPEDFDQQNPGLDRRIVVLEGSKAAVDVTACARDVPDRAVIEALRAVAPVAQRSAPGLAACAPAGAASPRFVVVQDECRFNWDRGEFYCVYRDRPVGELQIN